MHITTLLTQQRTRNNLPCKSKKRAIEASAQWLSEQLPNIDACDIFNALINREKLGSTGFGNGIAIPHCRLPNSHAVIGALIKLEQSIDFDAIDNQPVDLIFILLVPEDASNQHLQALSMLAENLQNPDYCRQLRAATNDIELYEAAIHHAKPVNSDDEALT